jgi:hypothetical protein
MGDKYHRYEMYDEEEGQYHPESVYYQGNKKENINSINERTHKVIRNCATILREFGSVEWKSLRNRIRGIVYSESSIDPNSAYQYMKDEVEKDERVTPPLSVTNRLYNQYIIKAIQKLVMKYKVFDLDVFLELLEDIQEVTYNAVPVNIPNIPYGTSNSQAELNLKKMSEKQKQAYHNQVQKIHETYLEMLEHCQ